MRMSCNGCRVLRKGCSENCSIRPCLQWIKNPESQAHATVFLAKFYGRAGLMNLINAGPENLRPAIFRSLLYEACGRIVNPIFGSVGLLWSGSWQLCQAAVEAVLKGEPITPIASETAADGQGPPLKAYDIRHVSKDENFGANGAKSRSRYKRSSAHGAVVRPGPAAAPARSASHESAVSQESDLGAPSNVESESTISEETTAVRGGAAEPEPSAQKQSSPVNGEAVELELTLGFDAPVARVTERVVVPVKKRRFEMTEECGWVEDRAGSCKIGLGL